MKRHEIALRYAEKATGILEPEYDRRYPNSLGTEKEREKFSSIVASGHFNAAVEYEFVEDFSNSLISYQKAVKISKINLG